MQDRPRELLINGSASFITSVRNVAHENHTPAHLTHRTLEDFLRPLTNLAEAYHLVGTVSKYPDITSYHRKTTSHLNSSRGELVIP